MSRVSPLRRGAAVVGATGLIALSLAGPAAARPDPSTGGIHEGTAGNSAIAGPESTPSMQVLRIDDNALEYLQLGAGMAAGLALGGAAMVLVSRRHSPLPRERHIVS